MHLLYIQVQLYLAPTYFGIVYAILRDLYAKIWNLQYYRLQK
jgi:hypothetical protein